MNISFSVLLMKIDNRIPKEIDGSTTQQGLTKCIQDTRIFQYLGLKRIFSLSINKVFFKSIKNDNWWKVRSSNNDKQLFFPSGKKATCTPRSSHYFALHWNFIYGLISYRLIPTALAADRLKRQDLTGFWYRAHDNVRSESAPMAKTTAATAIKCL